jgi:ABC-2 type transport system permease protein
VIETLASPQTNGMWVVVWKLLRLRLIILLRDFRFAKLRRKIGMILIGLLLLSFLGFIFYISLSLLRFLHSPRLESFSLNPAVLTESVPVLILSGAFIGILFTSFGVLLQALYLAGDMDFLLSAPIPIRSVFVAKLLQAILPNFGLICLFALPVLFGLGASAGYTILYYPLVLLLLSALALAAAGISSLLVMGVVRIFPARRVAELLGFIGGVVSLICSQSGQLANFSDFSLQQAQQAMGLIARVNSPYSPLTWVGRGLIWIGEARWLQGLGITTLTLLACGLIFAGALVTSEKLYYSGWASLHTVHHKKKPARKPRPAPFTQPAAQFLRTRTSSVVLQIIQKDMLMLRRDIRNMSQLVTPLILGVVYFIALLRGGNDLSGAASGAPAWTLEVFKSLRLYSSVGLALFVGWMLLSRLAGMGFSQEGKRYWMLKTAPISRAQLIGAKFLVAFVPVVALCWAFLLLTCLIQRPSVGVLLYSLPVIALTIAGNAGINLTFGIVGANMNWEDPRQMQRGVSGCLGIISSLIYLPVCLFLFFGPAILAVALRWSETIGQAGGLVLGSTFSLACAIIPLWLVRKRVDKLGES